MTMAMESMMYMKDVHENTMEGIWSLLRQWLQISLTPVKDHQMALIRIASIHIFRCLFKPLRNGIVE